MEFQYIWYFSLAFNVDRTNSHRLLIDFKQVWWASTIFRYWRSVAVIIILFHSNSSTTLLFALYFTLFVYQYDDEMWKWRKDIFVCSWDIAFEHWINCKESKDSEFGILIYVHVKNGTICANSQFLFSHVSHSKFMKKLICTEVY